MNIPNIPTDNIYKFSAIFGLVIFAGSIYLYQASDRNIHDAKIKIELSHQKLRADSINFDVKTEIYNLSSGMLQERIKNFSQNNLDIDYYSQENAEQKKDLHDILKISNEYRSSISNTLKNYTDLSYYEYEKKIYRSFAKFLIFFSILLISWGFASWYYKHQIYMDAEIKWKGQRFKALLKNADSISKSKPEQPKSNDDTPASI